MLARSLMYGLGGMTQVVCGVDQRHVRERLREVAYLPAQARVVFLRQQPEVVAKLEQALKQLARLVRASEHHVRVGQPEAAGDERDFAGRQTILCFTRVV